MSPGLAAIMSKQIAKSLVYGYLLRLQVKYPAAQPTLPLGLLGRSFSSVLGTNQSFMEALLLKRKIMGPSWISIKHPRRIDPQAQVRGCA